MKLIVLIVIILNSTILVAQDVCLSPEEKKLYDLIMEYRKSKKLKPLPYSVKLTQVAQAHVRDLAKNYDYENRGDCNPHSWSDKGTWTPCCYTADHSQAAACGASPKKLPAMMEKDMRSLISVREALQLSKVLKVGKKARDITPCSSILEAGAK